MPRTILTAGVAGGAHHGSVALVEAGRVLGVCEQQPGHTYEGANEILAGTPAPHVARALRDAGVEAGCSSEQ
jgi:hypothetical protein